MIRLTALLLSVLLLQGCAGLIVAGVVGGTVALNDERSLKTQLNDTDTDFAISAALNKHADINEHAHIRVFTVNRKVLVVGQAPSPQLRSQVIRIINDLKKTDQVYDQIRIGSPTAFSTRSHDTWLTTKVKSRMLNTENLDMTRIKVITENGEVFLMGLVTRAQANIAVDVARHTSGVKKVIRAFEYVE